MATLIVGGGPDGAPGFMFKVLPFYTWSCMEFGEKSSKADLTTGRKVISIVLGTKSIFPTEL